MEIVQGKFKENLSCKIGKIHESDAENTRSFAVRLPTELIKELKILCSVNDWTLQKTVCVILEDAVKSIKNEM